MPFAAIRFPPESNPVRADRDVSNPWFRARLPSRPRPPTGFRALFCLGLILGLRAVSGATPEAWAADLSQVFDRLVRDRRILGAQVVVGRNDEVRFDHFWGRRFPGRPEAVNGDTQFCIGSDSKPMTTALVFTLVADGTLGPDDPVAKWLPEFSSLQTVSGAPAERSPTLRELMSHRGGIYGQNLKPTPEQLALIRNYSRTLEESVSGIARQPLLTQPGQAFAYSGAGYCVLGRVAEVAGHQSIEALLQARLCGPLALRRTTYFPGDEPNVAVGSRLAGGRLVPITQAPHLAKPRQRFALVGGGIYSTARDQARFARMVLAQGRGNGSQVLPPSVWSEWIGRQERDSDYGLGWKQTFGRSPNRPTRLEHQGSLAGYRASLAVNLESGFFCAANWTLVVSANSGGSKGTIRDALHRAEKALAR